jgi:hypothetical protein
MSKRHSRQSGRSFFWPVVLLGTGIIWLLTNLGFIPTENLWLLFQLWPVLIIMIGLEVIFSRRLPAVGALLALLMIGGVIFVLLGGDQLNLATRPDPRTESFVVSAQNTSSAAFNLNLSTLPVAVTSLEGSENLLTAEIGHFGDVELTVAGGEEKQIVLERRGVVSSLNWLLQESYEGLSWELQLSTEVPFDLAVDGSTGKIDLDLSGVQISRFNFDGSTGASTIVLPASQPGYAARVEGGTGQVELILPVTGNLTLRLVGSTGQITLDVPEGAALQLEVQRGGTGNVIAPDWIEKVEGLENRDEGVYQTEGFESAEYQLMVIMENLSTGDLVIE